MNESFRSKRAIALSYDQKSEHAPKVSATGKGYVAEQIIEKAREASVPIQEDPNLIELLGELNINEKIPEELYQVVAEVFSYIYHVDKNLELDQRKTK